MKILKRKIPENCNIFQVGDTHEGSQLCYEKGILRMIEEVQSDADNVLNLLVFHGDAIEGITIDDPRFYFDNNKIQSIMRQKKRVEELFKPLAKSNRIVVWLQGNHERKLWRFGDISWELCDSLSVPYGTFSAIIHYHSEKTGKLLFKQYATHGFGSVNSKAWPRSRAQETMSIQLEMKLKDKVSDCVLRTMGHTHKLIVRKPTDELLIYSDKNLELQETYLSQIKFNQAQVYIPSNLVWYVNTGCFMRTFVENLPLSGYGEVTGYDPLQLGYAVVRIRDGRLVDVIERRI